ncbi:hypothetical protein GCM10022214_78160 [Actinomadura miaoliensis]|uniref:Uncharacterized protein n=1 Tax=Actinomadura miaoliensis TaxID=430685 RepID=A0ABP7X062_9ACTN
MTYGSAEADAPSLIGEVCDGAVLVDLDRVGPGVADRGGGYRLSAFSREVEVVAVAEAEQDVLVDADAVGAGVAVEGPGFLQRGLGAPVVLVVA